MTGHLATGTRCWTFRCLLALLLTVAWAAMAHAETGPTIMRVEEDWELILATPDPDSDAPQVTCVISPTGDVTSVYAAFELNHQSLPSFTPGGLQLQVWDGEVPLSHRRFPTAAILAQPEEVVRWTQSVELVDGCLVFEIVGGSSGTWGRFGGQGYLKSGIGTTLQNLNAYHPSVSVANSGVSYAANRVESLILRTVRVVTSTGEVLEDPTVRPVYQQP